ncbi:hypothetical protein Pmani_008624 [Petrolisthes manimaculis]|uniref:Uncharacterized protein n=1 Tax=Petrolisthes manimaculis TaxID=1843537 RepID=A0AAE1Q5Y0_9EUCA|nr:hypothetical protein Pmani_008624 [Petrolisthes manimaculis]
MPTEGAAFHDSSGELRDETSGELRDETSGEVRDETSGELRDETSGELRDETSGEVRDETSGELRDEASGEVRDETSGEVRDETSGEVQDEASGEMKDEEYSIQHDNDPFRNLKVTPVDLGGAAVTRQQKRKGRDVRPLKVQSTDTAHHDPVTDVEQEADQSLQCLLRRHRESPAGIYPMLKEEVRWRVEIFETGSWLEVSVWSRR